MNSTQVLSRLEAVSLQVKSLSAIVEGLVADAQAEAARPEAEAWVGLKEFTRISGIGKTSLYNLWARDEGPPHRRRGRALELPLKAASARETWTHGRLDAA